MDTHKFKWHEVMVAGKYYHLKYKWKGKQVEEDGVFKEYNYGNLYFMCNNGDWIIIKPHFLISATTS